MSGKVGGKPWTHFLDSLQRDLGFGEVSCRMLEVGGRTYDPIVANHFRTLGLAPETGECGSINLEQLGRSQQ